MCGNYFTRWILMLALPLLSVSLHGQTDTMLKSEHDSLYLEIGGKQYSFSHKQIAQMQLDDAIKKCKADNFEQASAHFSKAKQFDADNWNIYYNSGLCQYYQKNFEKALEELNEALRLKPDELHVLNQRGITYSMLDETDKAFADFENVLAGDPNFPNVHFNIAILYFENFDIPNGCAFLEKAKEQNNPKAKELYGNYCIKD